VSPDFPEPLLDLPAGIEAVVDGLVSADPDRIHRLASLGILPGARISLVRRGAVFLAQVDGGQVAFDGEVARAIRVRRV